MDRALRRHRERIAAVREIRFIWCLWGPESRALRKPWRARNQLGRYLMHTPGHWIRDMMTRPARARAKQLLRLAERGGDVERDLWPDYRKPHIYYW